MVSFRKRSLGMALGVLVLVAVGLALAAALPASTPPLWGVDDLPQVPAESDNGWVVVRDALRDDDLPSLAADLGLEFEDVEALWTAVAAHESAIEGSLRDASGMRTRALWVAMRARPEFADACPAEIERSCPDFALHLLTRFVRLEILLAAHRGRWAEASQLNVELLQMSADYRASARSYVANQIALELLAEALDVAFAVSWLAQRERIDNAALNELRETADEIRLDVDLTRAVVFEYLAMDRTLRHATDVRFEWLTEPWAVYSLRAIRPRLDALFVEALHLADGSATPDPDRAPPRCGWLVQADACNVLVAIDMSLFLRDHRHRAEQARDRALRAQQRLAQTRPLP